MINDPLININVIDTDSEGQKIKKAAGSELNTIEKINKDLMLRIDPSQSFHPA